MWRAGPLEVHVYAGIHEGVEAFDRFPKGCGGHRPPLEWVADDLPRQFLQCLTAEEIAALPIDDRRLGRPALSLYSGSVEDRPDWPAAVQLVGIARASQRMGKVSIVAAVQLIVESPAVFLHEDQILPVRYRFMPLARALKKTGLSGVIRARA